MIVSKFFIVRYNIILKLKNELNFFLYIIQRLGEGLVPDILPFINKKKNTFLKIN